MPYFFSRMLCTVLNFCVMLCYLATIEVLCIYVEGSTLMQRYIEGVSRCRLDLLMSLYTKLNHEVFVY